MKRDNALVNLTGLAAVLALAGSASAQTLGDGGTLSAEAAVVEGPGIKVAEGVVIHPTVGLETGFISNVFYEEADENPAGLLRLLAELHISTLPPQRLMAEAPEGGSPDGGDFEFRAGFRVAYDEYLSTDDQVQAQRDLGLQADVRGIVFPQGTWVFAFADEFERFVRPTNFESSSNVPRDVNHLRLYLKYQPGGRALSATLRYQNTIDIFEEDRHRFANRLQHTFGLRTAWQWLPITQFYADASVGIFGGLGDDSNKVDSYPLRLLLGTSTALTEVTTINAQIGYGKGFYSEGDDFQNVLFGLEGGWRYSPLGRFKVRYRYDFQDSINANFLRDHEIKVSIDHQIVQLTLMAGFDVRFRRYFGLPPGIMAATPGDREDVIISADLGARYNFRDWLAATFDYHLVSDQTDFRYMTDGLADDPSYVRHDVFAGVLASF